MRRIESGRQQVAVGEHGPLGGAGGAYEIMSIPTIVVFVNGEIKEQVIGVQSKQSLLRLLGL